MRKMVKIIHNIWAYRPANLHVSKYESMT